MVSYKDVKDYYRIMKDCSLIVWDFKSYQIGSYGIRKNVKNSYRITKDFHQSYGILNPTK